MRFSGLLTTPTLHRSHHRGVLALSGSNALYAPRRHSATVAFSKLLWRRTLRRSRRRFLENALDRLKRADDFGT